MAYTGANLSLSNRTIEGGLREWFYIQATDSIATILGAGYFSDATNRGMQKGDLVWLINQSTPTLTLTQVSTVAAGTLASPGAATVIGASDAVFTDNIAGVVSQTLALNAVKQVVTIPVQLVDLATGTLKLAIPFAFTVVGTPQFRVAKPATTAAKAATATLQVSGVAATGGVISLTSANCTPMGAAVAASAAVTALGVGAAGGTVEFALSAVTAFIEGDGYFEVVLINNDLANAISSIAALG